MSGHRIKAAGLGKRYGTVQALSGIDLDIEPGEFLVLLGPSGSGKSTLVRALAGVERLDTGLLEISGRTVDDGGLHVPPERRDLGMVFQDYALWPHLTVAQNVAFALRRRRLSRADSAARTAEALGAVGLGEYARRFPSDLSGGQQQRVALARAIVSRPGLLLFDEPLSNLDADLRERLRLEISRVTRLCGATAVYITHDQSEAFALADRIGVLDEGRLVQLDRPEEVYQRPATPFVARFTGCAGELPVQVAAAEGERATVHLGGAALTARALGPLREGEMASMIIRPDAAAFTSRTEADAVQAVVTDVAYRGRGYEHAVRTEAGMLTGLHSATRVERGAQVGIRLTPEGCHVHPERCDTGDEMNVTAVSFEPERRVLLQGRQPAL
ncbi:ABC transporter ATP-binding protein [Sinomonas sp.]|uniref:ABC transporter ATP-binding protein n=1 Tax=Sinomonas sp. TaxID=1914986 RepID=UPI002FE36BCB